MQISRLFEIVYMLLTRDTVTADALARHFEVSKRTIYRDVDTLSGAGIPVYTAKGRGGGIRILPGFTLSRGLLTQEEQGDLLAAMRTLAITQVPNANAVLDKLGAVFQRSAPDWIAVDFSDWGSINQQKFNTLKAAILERRVITFAYFNTQGQKRIRCAEPVQLWFKHRAWYLRAYCLDKGGPRLFKLSRMRELATTPEPCTHPPEDTPGTQSIGSTAPVARVRLHISAALAYRVYDEFEEAQVERLEDGSFIVHADFIEDDWLYGYLLSFGGGACVLEPQSVRERLRERIALLHMLYENNENEHAKF